MLRDSIRNPTCLDYAATTPLRPEALADMQPVWADVFGNPSGTHELARRAKTLIEVAREGTAVGLGCEPREVVFTGGGTEADNMAVKGAARAGIGQGLDGVVVSAFEHHAVLEAAERLENEGFRVSTVPVTAQGIIDLDRLADVLDERTAVVSLMLVNNEVGTIQPLEDAAGVVRERAPRALFHTDAIQAPQWLDVAAATRSVDLVSVSAHKFGGPKGTGALVVRGKARLVPLVDGGGQEMGRRSGTHNVAGIAGMAAALRTTVQQRAEEVARIGKLRDRLVEGLREAIPDARFNGAAAHQVAGTCHVGFPGVEAEALLLMLDRDGVCAAAGSSCQSGSMDPSHVLMAMGLSRDLALASIRLSLGWPSTDDDIDRALAVIPASVERLRTPAATAR
ncbi:MAG TPA: cysteine desulfurase family protein [Acidimicrobiia bacterium]|nr:cysteine desulfurase family protein [Acidimicrobiia bacterium]